MHTFSNFIHKLHKYCIIDIICISHICFIFLSLTLVILQKAAWTSMRRNEWSQRTGFPLPGFRYMILTRANGQLRATNVTQQGSWDCTIIAGNFSWIVFSKILSTLEMWFMETKHGTKHAHSSVVYWETSRWGCAHIKYSGIHKLYSIHIWYKWHITHYLHWYGCRSLIATQARDRTSATDAQHARVILVLQISDLMSRPLLLGKQQSHERLQEMICPRVFETPVQNPL